MTARRSTFATAAATLAAPLALTALGTSPAAAHGSLEDPVSRVYACYSEGPEAPQSAACKAAIAASGTQAFYDWNEVNIPDAGGNSKEIIPDGELCSAGRDKYKGLDLPRADWPASDLTPGEHSFTYKATAPHAGTFELYITKEGYDPSQPLKWADLESEPFATVTDPRLEGGSYVIDGTVPERSGRHLIYSIWQRSDSPEAFYTCSDVVFGGGGGGQGVGDSALPDASEAPAEDSPAAETGTGTEQQGGHEDHSGHTGQTEETDETEGTEGTEGTEQPGDAGDGQNAPAQKGGSNLAETGGDSSVAPVAIGAAAAFAVGAAALFNSLRRRAYGRHRA